MAADKVAAIRGNDGEENNDASAERTEANQTQPATSLTTGALDNNGKFDIEAECDSPAILQKATAPTSKKRSRATGMKYKKRKVPSDLRLAPELELRLQAFNREKEAEELTSKELKEAEVELVKALEKVDQAKQVKQAASDSVDAASVELCRGIATTPGPWQEYYNQLVSYHADQGSCIVRGQTGDLRSLRAWTLKQRERYHIAEGNANKLPWYRVKLLDKLDFLWKISDDTWDKHYADLVEYKKEFGHTAVPRGYKPNPTLAHWVKRVRHGGNKQFKGDPSSGSMTKEQLKKLQDLGFVWENLNRSWNVRFEELKIYKEEHGHCLVSKDSTTSVKLVKWCQNARAHHRAYMLGKKTTMTLERKLKLEELGFPWEIFGGKERPAKFQKLEANSDNEDDVGSDDDDEGTRGAKRGPNDRVGGHTQPETEPPQNYNARGGDDEHNVYPTYSPNPYHQQPPHHHQGFYHNPNPPS